MPKASLLQHYFRITELSLRIYFTKMLTEVLIMEEK